MNRKEFLEQLERLLQDIPESERKAALEYYQDYFEDAGEEKESQVIQELGSPGKVAAIIRADLEEDFSRYGEYTERGYSDQRFQEKEVPGTTGPENSCSGEEDTGEERVGEERTGEEAAENSANQEENNWDGIRYREPKREQSRQSYDGPYSRAGYGRGYGQRRHSRSGAGWILLILFAIVAVPIFLGVGAGLLSAVVGIICGIIGLFAGGIGLFVGGIMMLVHSLVFQLASPPTAVTCVGLSLMMTAVGILLIVAFLWLMFKVFPAVFRWAVDLIQRIFHRGIRGGENS